MTEPVPPAVWNDVPAGVPHWCPHCGRRIPNRAQAARIREPRGCWLVVCGECAASE